MNTFDTLLSLTFYHNTLGTWFFALGIGLFVLIGLLITQNLTAGRIKAVALKTETDLSDFAAQLVQKTQLFLLAAVGIYAGAQVLVLPSWLAIFINKLPFFALLFQLAFWANMLIEFILNRYVNSRKSEDERRVSQTMVAPLKFIAFALTLGILVLVGLDNLGVNVTTLVTGLGIGGVAIALAVKNIVGDLFAAFSIVADKPFVIGDFLVVGDFRGTVEHIGLKTTRLRGMDGEEIIFGNEDILQSRLRNYQRMTERRIQFSLGVTYDTPAEKLAAIPGMLQSIIESVPLTRFDRAHFKSYGDSALNFEIVYFIQDIELKTYMDIQQTINLAIYRQFDETGIQFAFPSRTLYVGDLNGQPLSLLPAGTTRTDPKTSETN